MLNLIAIDTSESLSKLIFIHGANVCMRIESQLRGNTNVILDLLNAQLNEMNLKILDFEALVYVQGPGSFTGLRMSAGVVQALAYVHKIPIVSLSKLQLLAQTCWMRYQHERVLIALGALKNDVYFGDYQREAGQQIMRPAQPDGVMTEESFMQKASKITTPVVFIGDVCQQYKNQLNAFGYVLDEEISLEPEHIHALALDAIQKNHIVNPIHLEPFYLKEPHIGGR